MKSLTACPARTTRLGIHSALILLTSVAMGLAYNALNPVGLRWSERSQPESTTPKDAPVGLYAVEMVHARPISSSKVDVIPNQPAAAAPVPSPAAARTLGTASRTTWEQAKPLVETGEVILVDARPRLTYDAGHIPRAVSLPENEIAAKIGAFYSTYPPSSTRLVIYCSSINCGSSAKLASLLTQKYGYRDVQYVPGGYLDWLQTQKGTPH